MEIDAESELAAVDLLEGRTPEGIRKDLRKLQLRAARMGYRLRVGDLGRLQERVMVRA